MLCTWSPEFRPFIIIRDNIELKGRMYTITYRDVEDFPLDNYSEKEKELLNEYSEIIDNEAHTIFNDRIIRHNIIKKCYNFELPTELTVPIPYDEYLADLSKKQTMSDTLRERFMDIIYQNCLSAELYIADQKYMDKSVHELNDLYEREVGSWRKKYGDLTLPPNILERYGLKTPSGQTNLENETR